MNRFFWHLILMTALSVSLTAQEANRSIEGVVIEASQGDALIGASVMLIETAQATATNDEGRFRFRNIGPGPYTIVVTYVGFEDSEERVELVDTTVFVVVKMEERSVHLEGVTIEDETEDVLGLTRLRAVEGTAIYASKKNEVVVIDNLTANLAANQSRQIYARVPGLNIWESDGAGIQLGIGGRGLSPNRNSNFNTRQNGYDISADALGYPESYYSPPAEAIDKVEIVRGAASLQYGTQFGGMLNFKFKEAPDEKALEVVLRQTIGSFGFLSSFNSIGGHTGKAHYYGFYQYKRSKGWRPNSSLDQHTAFASASFSLHPKIALRLEYTHMNYLAQQPGGLTDAQFEMDPRQSNRERNWFQVDWNLMAVQLDYRMSDRSQLNSRTFGLLAGRDALGNLDAINLADFGDERDFLSDDFRNWGNETRFIHRYSTWGNPSVFLTGIRYYDGLTKRRQGNGNRGSGPEFEYLNPDNLEGSDFRLPSKNLALFVEHIFNLTPKISLTPGVRYEYIRTQTDGYYRQIVRDLAGNILTDVRINERKTSKRNFAFFGIGASFKPKDALEFYGNFSQNYRAINFNDIRVTLGSLVVDPDLKDERGFNTDIGFRGQVKNVLNFDISLFYLAYNDRIGTILKTEPNPQFNNLIDRTFRFRTNIADARIQGLESFAELNVLGLLNRRKPSTHLSVFANIAWIDAEYTDSQENAVTGNDVELVPPFNFKTGLTLGWRDLKLAYQFSYVQRHFSDASNAIRTPSAIEGIIPSYSVMDISLRYTMGAYRLEAGVNNLADQAYFTRRATGYPGPGIIPADGRSVYLTLVGTFGK